MEPGMAQKSSKDSAVNQTRSLPCDRRAYRVSASTRPARKVEQRGWGGRHGSIIFHRRGPRPQKGTASGHRFGACKMGTHVLLEDKCWYLKQIGPPPSVRRASLQKTDIISLVLTSFVEMFTASFHLFNCGRIPRPVIDHNLSVSPSPFRMPRDLTFHFRAVQK